VGFIVAVSDNVVMSTLSVVAYKLVVGFIVAVSDNVVVSTLSIVVSMVSVIS
jgi:hypothetical protein